MSQRVYLTKTFIEAAKRTPATGRVEYRDAEVRGLLLRVSAFGYKSFSLCARFPGQHNPSRRSIGEYGTVSLDEARETACQWKAMIRRGIDPRRSWRRSVRRMPPGGNTTSPASSARCLRNG